jgi:hypothetical protein
VSIIKLAQSQQLLSETAMLLAIELPSRIIQLFFTKLPESCRYGHDLYNRQDVSSSAGRDIDMVAAVAPIAQQ